MKTIYSLAVFWYSLVCNTVYCNGISTVWYIWQTVGFCILPRRSKKSFVLIYYYYISILIQYWYSIFIYIVQFVRYSSSSSKASSTLPVRLCLQKCYRRAERRPGPGVRAGSGGWAGGAEGGGGGGQTRVGIVRWPSACFGRAGPADLTCAGRALCADSPRSQQGCGNEVIFASAILILRT